MADNISGARRRNVMRSIKSRDSSLELAVRSYLHRRGLRFRLYSSLPGRPDIVFKSANLVVFIDSCFWHGCPQHCRMPHSNTSYWTAKIARNKRRDEIVNSSYSSTRWKVLRFWEHEIIADLERCGRIIQDAYAANRSNAD